MLREEALIREAQQQRRQVFHRRAWPAASPLLVESDVLGRCCFCGCCCCCCCCCCCFCCMLASEAVAPAGTTNGSTRCCCWWCCCCCRSYCYCCCCCRCTVAVAVAVHLSAGTSQSSARERGQFPAVATRGRRVRPCLEREGAGLLLDTLGRRCQGLCVHDVLGVVEWVIGRVEVGCGGRERDRNAARSEVAVNQGGLEERGEWREGGGREGSKGMEGENAVCEESRLRAKQP